MRVTALGVFLLSVGALSLSAQEPLRCLCDHTTHAAYDQRNCGLCAEVDKAPTNVEVVFVKDNDPKKPNRWLACCWAWRFLPRGSSPWF